MTSEALVAAYRRCEAVNRAHGTTYYWSTRLLPAVSRPHVYALYAFCRLADDIVDDLGPVPVSERAAALADFAARFRAAREAGHSEDPILSAVIDTATRFAVPAEAFNRFIRSMTMDLTVDHYPTFPDLLDYMDGSAAVIGEMMLPVLRPFDQAAAFGPARDLGIAFQLTNFWRDVAEDLDRGRTYLPDEDIDRFDARPALEGRRVTREWRTLMRFELARTRRYYASAEAGIALLPPPSARCIAGARDLYGGILARIERVDYDVFARRVRVPSWRKLAVAARVAIPGGGPSWRSTGRPVGNGRNR